MNDVQEKWLGTLTSVPNKGKKVPRHAPACLIGCAAYECVYKGIIIIIILGPTSTKPQAEILKLNNVNACNDISFGDHSILEGDRQGSICRKSSGGSFPSSSLPFPLPFPPFPIPSLTFPFPFPFLPLPLPFLFPPFPLPLPLSHSPPFP